MTLLRRLRVLKVLQDRPGLRLYEPTIAALAKFSGATIGPELAELERDGLIESDQPPGDPMGRRRYWLKPPQ
jgi:DNA-binding MarR family transcriptional regulator